LEATHTTPPVPKRKRNLEGGTLAYPNGLELNVTNMEIDEAHDTHVWIVLQFFESKLIV
jgi:hypothetical protein